jgi:periplasmic protein TonB
VGESLWRRVAELKRYPTSARLNGYEGRVVVRAVIKADGNLMDVQVHKSSGYELLDEAALEVVRKACPLHMRHELEVAHVVINLPIIYSLKR